jgi:hypothetical protein
MCDIPVAIDNTEIIVRAVFSNHLKKNKTTLDWKVFDDPQDRASVMRHTHLGSDECKRRALRIKQRNAGLKYKGFAVIQAQGIRSTGAEVYDSREAGCGHAHVSTNIAVPPEGDPLHAKTKYDRDQRLRALQEKARFLPDPDPTADMWSGDAIGL